MCPEGEEVVPVVPVGMWEGEGEHQNDDDQVGDLDNCSVTYFMSQQETLLKRFAATIRDLEVTVNEEE